MQEHLKKCAVSESCRSLKVSESGYYRWLKSVKKPKTADHLLVKVKKILSEAPENDNYGARRMYIAIRQAGEKVSYSTVYRVMKRNGLIHKSKHYPNGITREDQAAIKSENLIHQDFSSENPNEKWLTDITEIPCSNGKLYVAPIFDCYDGAIVGLAMADNMKKELCISAFKDACRRTGARGMILHSDRGSQFTSSGFREILAKYGAIQSMSSVGRCYDNCRMESFFATLKKEKLYRIRTEKYTIEQIKTIVFRYIMVYYNRIRIYTANPGGLPPMVYRKKALRAAA